MSTCVNDHPCLYSDPEAECQAFHVCAADGRGGLAKYSFLCPNGTLFSQEYFICDWWFNFDCAEAENLYRYLNLFWTRGKKGGKLMALQGLVLRFLFVFNNLVSRINDLTSIFPTAWTRSWQPREKHLPKHSLTPKIAKHPMVNNRLTVKKVSLLTVAGMHCITK